MRAKLESAVEALEAGIAEVVIAPGAAPDIVAQLLAGHAIGTRLVTHLGASRVLPSHDRQGVDHA